MTTPRPVDERFWEKVDSTAGPDHCWPWLAGTSHRGYRSFVLSNGSVAAKKRMISSRMAWTLDRGEIPTGKHVLHHCDNPPCCNPNHLFIGTRKDNMRDMANKGRGNTTKLSARSVQEIRRRYAAGNIRQVDLGEEFGVTHVTIGRAIRGESWALVGESKQLASV